MGKIYEQKKGSNNFAFEFINDELVYSEKTSTSNSISHIPFTSVLKNTWDFYEKNEWYRNVAFLWLFIGLVFEIPLFFQGNFRPFWLLLGLLALFIYFFTQIKYTVVETDKKRILIIKDKQHDQILSLIFENRKKYLKEFYGSIDFNNNSDSEKRKFEVLLKEEIINEEEYETIIKEIENHQKDKFIPSPFTN